MLIIKDRLKHQCRIAQGEDVDEQLARLGFKAADLDYVLLFADGCLHGTDRRS